MDQSAALMHVFARLSFAERASAASSCRAWRDASLGPLLHRDCVLRGAADPAKVMRGFAARIAAHAGLQGAWQTLDAEFCAELTSAELAGAVEVAGLVGAVQHNGKRGTVLDGPHPDTGRYRVLLDAGGKPLGLKVRKMPSWPRSWANFSLF